MLHGCACDTVVLSLDGDALSSQGHRVGSYVQVDGLTREGRAVYHQEGGLNYLYVGSSSVWILDVSYKDDLGGLFSADKTPCPEDSMPICGSNPRPPDAPLICGSRARAPYRDSGQLVLLAHRPMGHGRRRGVLPIARISPAYTAYAIAAAT
jgi:hypothetical protein